MVSNSMTAKQLLYNLSYYQYREAILSLIDIPIDGETFVGLIEAGKCDTINIVIRHLLDNQQSTFTRYMLEDLFQTALPPEFYSMVYTNGNIDLQPLRRICTSIADRGIRVTALAQVCSIACGGKVTTLSMPWTLYFHNMYNIAMLFGCMPDDCVGMYSTTYAVENEEQSKGKLEQMLMSCENGKWWKSKAIENTDVELWSCRIHNYCKMCNFPSNIASHKTGLSEFESRFLYLLLLVGKNKLLQLNRPIVTGVVSSVFAKLGVHPIRMRYKMKAEMLEQMLRRVSAHKNSVSTNLMDAYREGLKLCVVLGQIIGQQSLTQAVLPEFINQVLAFPVISLEMLTFFPQLFYQYIVCTSVEEYDQSVISRTYEYLHSSECLLGILLKGAILLNGAYGLIWDKIRIHVSDRLNKIMSLTSSITYMRTGTILGPLSIIEMILNAYQEMNPFVVAFSEVLLVKMTKGTYLHAMFSGKGDLCTLKKAAGTSNKMLALVQASFTASTKSELDMLG